MQHLIIIGTVFPEPNSTAAGSRMLQLIGLFREMDFRISFLSTAVPTPHSFDLQTIGIECYTIKLNDSSFNELLQKLSPDAVVFDRFMTEEQFGWRVAETCPKALRILDTEDLHFLRNARETAYKQQRETRTVDYQNDIFKREVASIYRCDISLIISEFEYGLLTQTFKIDTELLFYIPFLVEFQNSASPDFEERRHFVSIGNFLHSPNKHTVLRLKQLWKPIKQQLPHSELHIYGAYPSEKEYGLHNEKDGFLVKGRAEVVREVFEQARVLLAPIPFGAGLKGKLLESMQFGLPNVTTAVGAEGMQHQELWNGSIAENDEQFVNSAVQLYTNPEMWQQSKNNGFTILQNKFDRKLFADDFKQKITQILLNIDRHRERNFIGQILYHHTLQSTKYMSKWIEVKNK